MFGSFDIFKDTLIESAWPAFDKFDPFGRHIEDWSDRSDSLEESLQHKKIIIFV